MTEINGVIKELLAQKPTIPPTQFNQVYHDRVVSALSPEWYLENRYHLPHGSSRWRYVEWIRSTIQPHLQGRILDLGCGAGDFTYLLRGDYTIIGVDYSAESLRMARTIQAELHHRASFVSGDVTALPFEDHSIDRVYCIDVWEHLTSEQKQRAAHELKRVMAKGAKGWIITPNGTMHRLSRMIAALRRLPETEQEQLAAISHLDESGFRATRRQLQRFFHVTMGAYFAAYPLLRHLLPEQASSTDFQRFASWIPFYRSAFASYLIAEFTHA